ncbi:Hypothetical_protein [Hexamita inflata]|uniref:Hypothetical_protein n=1 Tax=Hexamita inflata TaxID=28002 RepID=A0AA86UDS8_9EUKA|nr:Hypothetical protein HINF_LOCUS41835 [Hexamita inflata]
MYRQKLKTWNMFLVFKQYLIYVDITFLDRILDFTRFTRIIYIVSELRYSRMFVYLFNVFSQLQQIKQREVNTKLRKYYLLLSLSMKLGTANRMKLLQLIEYYSGGPSKCFFELGRRMKFII